MKPFKYVFVLMLVVSLLLASCQSAAAPTTEANAPKEATTAPEEKATEAVAPGEEPTPTPIVGEAGTGDIKLVMWNGLTGSDGVTLVKMMQEYAKTNPNVSIRVEMMPWSTFYDKLMTSLVSGNPPDMFIMHDYTALILEKMGVVRDVTELFDTGGGTIPWGDFTEKAQNAVTKNGKVVGLPWDWHGQGLWWNKDLFKKAGLDPEKPPTTQQEFRDYCAKITTDKNGKHPGEDGFDYDNVTIWGCYVGAGREEFLPDIYQAGGDVTSPDFKVTINSPEAREVLNYKLDLIYNQKIAPVPAGFDPWGAFAAQQLAMYMTGTWFTNFVIDSKVPFGVAWYPKMLDKENAVWSSSHIIYIPTQNTGQKWDETKKLLTWLSDNSATWATAGMPPARNSVRNGLSSDPSSPVYPAYLLGKSFEDHGRYETPHPCYYELMDIWTRGISGIMTKSVGVDEGLAQIEKDMQAVNDRCNQ